VTSPLKCNANRRNARKSTGPRTIRGKLNSRMNARTHGLNIPITLDPKVQENVIQIARSIVGDDARYELLEQAIIIAEAELELRRIRLASLTIMERALGTINIRDVRRNATGDPHAMPDAFIRFRPILEKIRRYESRVYGRKTKALQRLCKLQ
jgi:hypothetical protein